MPMSGKNIPDSVVISGRAVDGENLDEIGWIAIIHSIFGLFIIN